jgi:thiol-disulfide isomerase/thioredoxin
MMRPQLRYVFSAIALGATIVTAAIAANSLKAPGLALSDSRGASVRLSDYKGRVVLLNSWATWCTGCKAEIPWFIEFASPYKSRGLAVIGVSMDDDGWKAVKPYLAEKKINYPVVVGNDDLAKLYGVRSLPVTLLIDREGKIAASHDGLVDKSIYEREIRMLLQDPAQTTSTHQ